MKNKIILFAALALLLSACSVAPASAPTATPVPLPTLAPAPTLEPSPTVAPTATVEPSPTALPTAPATSPAVNPSAIGICSNPFYPAQANARWEYQVTSAGAAPITYGKTITNVTDNSFTEHHAFDHTSVDQHWTCSSAGLTSAEFGNLHVHGQNQYNFTTTHSAGPTIPPPDQWTVGTQWSNSYDISGQIVQSGLNVSGTGTVNLDNNIVAQEQVTVPAGTFQAYRVDTSITIKLNANTGVVVLPVTINLQQSSWYARDVGLVKSTLKLEPHAATTELVSYTP